MFGKKKSKHAFSQYNELALGLDSMENGGSQEQEENPDDIYVVVGEQQEEEEEIEEEPKPKVIPVATIKQQKYKLDPHEAPEINDADIGFILRALDKTEEDDYMLKEIFKSDEVSCHIYSGQKFDLGRVDTKRMILIKIVGRLYHDLGSVMNTIVDSSLSDSALQEANVDITRIERTQKDNKGYSVAITRRNVFYKTIENQLDYCIANTAVYDPHKNRFIIVSKSCSHPKVQLLKHLKSRRSYTISGRIFEAEGDQTKYTEITFINYADFNKKDLIKKAYQTHAVDYHTNLVTRLNANMLKNFPAPKYSHGVYSTLLDFEKNYLDQIILSGTCPWEPYQKMESL